MTLHDVCLKAAFRSMSPTSTKQDKYMLGGLCYSFRSGSHRRRLLSSGEDLFSAARSQSALACGLV
jgi:hypothetical protein